VAQPALEPPPGPPGGSPARLRKVVVAPAPMEARDAPRAAPAHRAGAPSGETRQEEVGQSLNGGGPNDLARRLDVLGQQSILRREGDMGAQRIVGPL